MCLQTLVSEPPRDGDAVPQTEGIKDGGQKSARFFKKNKLPRFFLYPEQL